MFMALWVAAWVGFAFCVKPFLLKLLALYMAFLGIKEMLKG